MSYSLKLKELVERGFSSEYIESSLWASFSLNKSIHQISKDVNDAIASKSQ